MPPPCEGSAILQHAGPAGDQGMSLICSLRDSGRAFERKLRAAGRKDGWDGHMSSESSAGTGRTYLCLTIQKR